MAERKMASARKAAAKDFFLNIKMPHSIFHIFVNRI